MVILDPSSHKLVLLIILSFVKNLNEQHWEKKIKEIRQSKWTKQSLACDVSSLCLCLRFLVLSWVRIVYAKRRSLSLTFKDRKRKTKALLVRREQTKLIGGVVCTHINPRMLMNVWSELDCECRCECNYCTIYFTLIMHTVRVVRLPLVIHLQITFRLRIAEDSSLECWAQDGSFPMRAF